MNASRDPRDAIIEATPVLLARLADAGLRVRADGSDLVVTPASKLTLEQRAALILAKPAIFAVLADAVVCPSCDGWCVKTGHVEARDGRAFWCSDHKCCGRVVWRRETGP